MKKFYTLILAVMATLSASALSVTVELSNLSAAKVDTYFSGSGRNTLTFDPVTHTALAEYPEDSSMNYLYVDPVKPNTINSIIIYNEDGDVISKKEGKWGSLQLVIVPLLADGGRVEINAGQLEPDASMSVTLIGDPSKVMFSCNRVVHELKRGTQTVNYVANTDRPVYIVPQNVPQFYRVTVNGEVLPPYETSMGDWQYRFEQENGDEVVIETDYPEDATFQVTIAIPPAISSAFKVKVDDQLVDDPSSFAVKATSTLAVDIDDYACRVTTMTINDRVCDYYSGGYHAPVLADLYLAFEGYMIERPYDFAVYTGNWDIVADEALKNYGYEFYTIYGQQLKLNSGYNLLTFCTDDLPFSFRDMVQSTDVYVYLNDQPVAKNEWGGFPEFNYESGDVMKVYLSAQKQPEYAVSYEVDNMDLPPTVLKDLITPVTDFEAGHIALPGTIVKVASDRVSSVKANDEEVALGSDGNYAVEVNADTHIAIKGSVSSIANVAADAASGTRRIFDLRGIELPAGARLAPGLYLEQTPAGSRLIHIR